MDLASILGLLIAIVAIFGSELLTGSSLASLINVSAFILILGGTVGATMVSYSMKEITQLPSFLTRVFKNSEPDLKGTVDEMVKYAELARREGLLALEGKASVVSNPFLAHSLELASDAIEPEYVESILSSEIKKRQDQTRLGAEIMETAGGYSPTMGIIGTVMGLVHVLGNISDSEELAASIAVAFLATFYGIALANLFWLPLGGKLKHLADQQKLADEVVLEGILAIIEGTSPRLIRDQLETMAGLRLVAGAQKETTATVKEVRANAQEKAQSQ